MRDSPEIFSRVLKKAASGQIFFAETLYLALSDTLFTP
jgi:hypothetical protein